MGPETHLYTSRRPYHKKGYVVEKPVPINDRWQTEEWGKWIQWFHHFAYIKVIHVSHQWSFP